MTLNFDYDRRERIGFPEAVFCQSKTGEVIQKIAERFLKEKSSPILFTRLSNEKFNSLNPLVKENIDYDPVSKTAFINGVYDVETSLSVGVLCAGTSDEPVAREALRTLEYLGVNHDLFSDIGVAGIWRLESRLDEIKKADIIIAVAGMEGALASVLGGLLPQPIIAVPTSVGYGVGSGGQTALNSMLTSCAPGITVTNIDNGYGAACAAYRILNQFKK